MAYEIYNLIDPPAPLRTVKSGHVTSPPAPQRTVSMMYLRRIDGSLYPPAYNPAASVEFAGSATAESISHGELTVEHAFSGESINESISGGQFGIERQFSGEAVRESISGGSLSVPVYFTGETINESVSSGTLFNTAYADFAGGSLNESISTGTLTVEHEFISPEEFVGSGMCESISSGLMSDVFMHVDFEVPNWREFANPPAGSGAGAMIAQSAMASYPDRGNVGMLATLSAGTGTRTVYRNTATEKNYWHLRVMFAPITVAGGVVDFVQVLDGSDTEVAAVGYTPSSRTITVTLATMDTLTGTLPAGITWHCVELMVDAAAGDATLWINGHQVDTAAGSFDSLLAQTVVVGIVGQDSGAAGQIYIDELMLANRYLGPVRVLPTLDNAQDPATVLVVYNTDVADSMTFAQWYTGQRSIPAANLVGFALGADEEITDANAQQLKSDLADWIAANYQVHIRTLLLGYGCPGTVDAPGSGTALQSRLARLDDDTADLAGSYAVSGVIDPDDLPTRSTLAAPGSGKQYLVAEINAPSLADAQAIVTAGLALVTPDLVGREFTALATATDRLAIAESAWAQLVAFAGTLQMQQIRLPQDTDYGGSSHGHAIEFCEVADGDFDVAGQTKALFASSADNAADQVRS